MKWIYADESFDWLGILAPTSGPLTYKYEDGRTLVETYPDHYKLVPDDVADRLEKLRDEIRAITDEIEAL